MAVKEPVRSVAAPRRASARNANNRGRMIVLDGPDGAGKTTQAKLLKERLEAQGVDVLLLREPGGTQAGEAIRKLVLEQREIGLCPLTETFLFQAARAQLVEEVIRPALSNGAWIICDRFTLSTMVYQGFAGGVTRKVVEQLSQAAASGIVPDRYLVLWVPPRVGIKRRASRQADRMEAKGLIFIREVADAYLREARRNARAYRLVNGQGTVKEVQRRLWKQIEPLLAPKKKEKRERPVNV
jgi:dTMP kinase